MRGAVHAHDLPSLSAGSPERRVRVWTPPGYTKAARRRFPVLYLQDGQKLFGGPGARRTDSWKADATARELIKAKAIPGLILVGIDNAGEDRADEYTPVVWNGEGGGADAYANLLMNDIKPFVDRTYRTKPGPESTALGGSSLGALFSLYAGLRAPQSFGAIMAMSPSVFWGDDHILTTIERTPPSKTRIWLDVGRHETSTMRKGLREVHRALKRSGWPRDRVSGLPTLRVSEDPDGRHDEASWGRRFGRALRFLFPAERAAGARTRGASSCR